MEASAFVAKSLSQNQKSPSPDPSLGRGPGRGIDSKAPSLGPIFPLPLSPFELMMLAEDRPDYPMVAVIEIVFRGEVQRDPWERALQLVLKRHPLLTARVESKKGRPTSWVATDLPKIAWQNTEAEPQVAAPLDLSKTAGLRLHMICSDQHVRQRLELHHACCDGAGAFQFLQELYLSYAHLVSKKEGPVALEELSPEHLPERNHFASNSSGALERLARCAFGIREAAKFTLKKISPLRTEPVGHDSTRVMHPFLTLHGSRRQLARLRTASASQGTTLNDLLLRDLFLTIVQWNQNHQAATTNPRYRLLVPCDLRTPEDVRLPACNVMGYSFLTRRESDCNRSPATWEGIRDEMRFIREQNASLYFIRTIEFCHRFLGGIRSLAKPHRCLATALASNMGNPAQTTFSLLPKRNGKILLGDLEMEKIVAYPPLRQNTRVGIVANTYANQLSIGIRYDGISMSSVEGERFKELFQQNLEQTAAANNYNGH